MGHPGACFPPRTCVQRSCGSACGVWSDTMACRRVEWSQCRYRGGSAARGWVAKPRRRRRCGSGRSIGPGLRLRCENGRCSLPAWTQGAVVVCAHLFLRPNLPATCPCPGTCGGGGGRSLGLSAAQQTLCVWLAGCSVFGMSELCGAGRRTPTAGSVMIRFIWSLVALALLPLDRLRAQFPAECPGKVCAAAHCGRGWSCPGRR